MKESVQLVAFMLDEHRYGLRLSVVERVVQAVEVISLPSVTDIVMGGDKPGGPSCSGGERAVHRRIEAINAAIIRGFLPRSLSEN